MASFQSDVYVTMTGPALSRLLYENANLAGNQVGLLLGSVLHQLTDTISDSEISTEKNEISINIDSILPMPFFHDNAGKVDKKKITLHLNQCAHYNQQKDHRYSGFVGWYCYYRNSTFHFSKREHIIHRQLFEIAQNLASSTDPEHFVFCLLTSSANKATHTFKHSFMRFLLSKRSFEVVPMRIHNLGTSQQLQYQTRACPPRSAFMQKQLMEIVRQKQKLGGSECLLEAQKVIQMQLNRGASELCQKEIELIKLKEEVHSLQEKLNFISNQKKDSTKHEVTSGQTSEKPRRLTDSSHINNDNLHNVVRSPVEKKVDPFSVNFDSANTKEPTSPVFNRQNSVRGRNRTVRSSTSNDS